MRQNRDKEVTIRSLSTSEIQRSDSQPLECPGWRGMVSCCSHSLHHGFSFTSWRFLYICMYTYWYVLLYVCDWYMYVRVCIPTEVYTYVCLIDDMCSNSYAVHSFALVLRINVTSGNILSKILVFSKGVRTPKEYQNVKWYTHRRCKTSRGVMSRRSVCRIDFPPQWLFRLG